MKESDFSGTVSGRVRWVYNRRYCFFRPNTLPFDLKPGLRVRRRFRSTLMNLCRLDGALMNLTDRERSIAVKMLSYTEAVASSSIDSECPSVDGLYRSERVHVTNEGRCCGEVSGYCRALEYGMAECASIRKITSGVILKMHAILMESENGSSPGELRAEQSTVGGMGSLENARFVPTDPTTIQPLLENLLKYINTSMDEPLMKAALAHYQFEAIHPFRDGNGRMGRLLVSLILFTEGVLSYPSACFSGYLLEHRRTYINTLFEVSADDDFDSWFLFFLDSIGVQIDHSLRRMNNVLNVRREMLSGENNMNRQLVIDRLFTQPYMSIRDVMDITGMTRPGAIRLIGSMEEEGLLEEISGKQRGKVYQCKRICDLLS